MVLKRALDVLWLSELGWWDAVEDNTCFKVGAGDFGGTRECLIDGNCQA